MTHPLEGELQALVDGELPTGRAEAVRAHLAECPSCREALSGIHASSVTFTRAVERLDRDEPIAWSAEGRIESGRFGASLRWAALFVLFAGGAGAAAIAIGIPSGGQPDRAAESMVDGVLTSIPDAPGAAVAVRPFAGRAEVVLTNPSAGARVRVLVGASPDLRVDLRGTPEPRFETGEGRVVADLAGSAGLVTVEFPSDLLEGTVRIGDRVLARVVGVRVSPPEAGDEGIPIAPIP